MLKNQEKVIKTKLRENKTSHFLNLIVGKEKTYDKKGFASCSCVRKDTCFSLLQFVNLQIDRDMGGIFMINIVKINKICTPIIMWVQVYGYLFIHNIDLAQWCNKTKTTLYSS
jgi:hypothetical protein